MLHDPQWLAWLVPSIYALGALAALSSRRWWRALAVACGAACVIALAALASVFVCTSGSQAGLVDRTGPTVAALIGFLGWIIAGYSRNNLAGEPGGRRYVIALLLTLAAVSVVVTTGNLGVLVLAWTVSSLTLQPLLSFYRDRPAARLMARKKFLSSRLAELCLVGAAALLYAKWRSFDLSTLARLASAPGPLPLGVELAAVLLALAVLIKSAQLPVHGWLVQVMEAPTSVSALMHAGVVNLGGYVLIRMAPLVSACVPAQVLLVVVGSATAALAGLTMMTCSSVKVRLAWSTCSQMGWMLTECGLGLYDLALLHLLAHALYKAHAFLCCGEAVRDSLAQRMLTGSGPAAQRRGSTRPFRAAGLGALCVAGSAFLWHALLHVPAIAWIAALCCALGIAAAQLERSSAPGIRWRSLAIGLFAVQLYLGWDTVVRRGLGVGASSPETGLAIWAGACFTALYLVQCSARRSSGAPGVAPILHWAAAGYFLDEPLTRLITARGAARGAAARSARVAPVVQQHEPGAA